MPKYINLEDAKQHLRVDFADDDAYIMSILSAAEATIESEIGDPPNPKEDEEGEPIIGLRALEDEDGNLPGPVRQAILLKLGDFYNSREDMVFGVSVNKLPGGIDKLLSKFLNRTAG